MYVKRKAQPCGFRVKRHRVNKHSDSNKHKRVSLRDPSRERKQRHHDYRIHTGEQTASTAIVYIFGCLRALSHVFRVNKRAPSPH